MLILAPNTWSFFRDWTILLLHPKLAGIAVTAEIISQKDTVAYENKTAVAVDNA